MSAILAIESSTLTASVALLVDDALVIERESGVNTHSETLIALVDECLRHGGLKLSGLSTIAVGAGPGSFTGLRIGMATVKGLCFASGVSMTPISSLAAMAHDRRQDAPHCRLRAAVLDARRKEIFVACYRENEALCEEQVMRPEGLAPLLASLQAEGESPVLFGDGAAKYAEEFQGLGELLSEGRQTPSAAAVAYLARKAPSAELITAAPAYVRLPEAQIKFPDGNTGGTFSSQRKTKA